LFGLQQVVQHLRGIAPRPPRFVPLTYRIVPHPLYGGWLFALWCTPVMTVAHLRFAVLTTGYILVTIQLEERDLMCEHPEWALYRQQVPMIVPEPPRRLEAV
jgi:protein-S-isoprenylcysteine O-methyltransferase Ste14